jgi:hypothetical protein
MVGRLTKREPLRLIGVRGAAGIGHGADEILARDAHPICDTSCAEVPLGDVDLFGR